MVFSSPEFQYFLTGCAGAIAPESWRLYNLRTNHTFRWSWGYVACTIPFIVVAGFIAWILDPSNGWAAFYSGLTAPVLITAAMKDTAKAQKELSELESAKAVSDRERDTLLAEIEDLRQQIAKIRPSAEFAHSKSEFPGSKETADFVSEASIHKGSISDSFHNVRPNLSRKKMRSRGFLAALVFLISFAAPFVIREMLVAAAIQPIIFNPRLLRYSSLIFYFQANQTLPPSAQLNLDAEIEPLTDEELKLLERLLDGDFPYTVSPPNSDLGFVQASPVASLLLTLGLTVIIAGLTLWSFVHLYRKARKSSAFQTFLSGLL
jgi:hypothetical protein